MYSDVPGGSDENLKRIIVYLLCGAAFFMPLFPLAGDICTALAMAAAAWQMLQRRHVAFVHSSLQRPVLAFILWSLLSTAGSPVPFMSGYNWVYNVGVYGSLYYLTLTYIDRDEDRRLLLRVVLAAALLVCLYGFYQYAHSTGAQLKEWVDASQFPKLRRRMFSTLSNPNLLGAYLLIILSQAGTIVLLYRKYRRDWVFLGLSLIFLVCMILTYSRGTWISFAFMVMYWGIALDRRLLWTLLLVPLVLFFYHGEVATRLWSLFTHDDTSINLRMALWDSTTYMIADHPLFGIGWDAFSRIYPEYNYYIQTPGVIIYHAHNMYLNLAAETGLPGAAFFTGSMLWHAVKAQKLPHAVNAQQLSQAAQEEPVTYESIVKYSMTAMIIGIAVSGIFDYTLFSHQASAVFWQLLGWGAGVVVKDERQL